jgi:palmitoyltransferase
MALMRSASACVIRCFKNVEHVADVLTGAAGPVFIALAWALTGTIGFSFCEYESIELRGRE